MIMKEFLGGKLVLHGGDSREILKGIPDNSIDSIVTDLSLGIAAEHLVCFDVIMQGYTAFMTDQTCAYDIIVVINRVIRPLRVQVKATRSQRSIPQRKGHIPAYMWSVRRAGKGGARNYDNNEFDILALVAIDIAKIAYLIPDHVKKTVHIRPPGTIGGKQFSDYSLSKALDHFK